MKLDRMAEAIGAFVKVSPWRMIDDGGALIFGLENEKGQISYAVVAGPFNGCSLALCRDQQALGGYAALLDAVKNSDSELEEISLRLDLDCLEVKIHGEKVEPLEEWLSVFGVEYEEHDEFMPRVAVYRSGMIPAFPGRKDMEALSEAMLAAVDYAAKRPAAAGGMIPCAAPDGKDGFVWKEISLAGSMNLQFPSPALDDELAARRLRRLPVSGAEFRCGVRRLPIPGDDDGLSVSTVMMMIDSNQGVIGAPMIVDYEKDYATFAAQYIGYVEEFGRPSRILATDPRTYSLLNELAAQMSTPIQRVGSMPEINDAIEDMMEFIRSGIGANEDEEDEWMEDEPRTEVPGTGGVPYDGFTGTMEEVGAHLMADCADPGQEENLLVRVTYPEDPTFWLYAAVKMDATLRHIDNFIRNTWVECCGHASFFEEDGVQYTSNTRILPGRSMNAKAADVLKPGVPVDYEYDLGTPTDLQVEQVGMIRMESRREKLLYLAQNYMPKYKCVRCGRRAELVARPGLEPIADSVICARCSRKETESGRYLPLLNSPRTGVCGYGLWFDDEEDE